MNKIWLSGTVGNIEYSHDMYGEKFYKATMSTNRISGTPDVLNCVISEALMGNVIDGIQIDVCGEIRTRNLGNSTDLFVFVNNVGEYNGVDSNYVELFGYICREPKYRETPSGRQLCDVLIASNRERSNKSDYLPCIAWGRSAMRMEELGIGSCLSITGRLQSREYRKRLDDGTVLSKTTYEVSISRFEVIKEEDEG